MGRTNSLTSAKLGDGLGFIRIWATLPRRLVFWDGAPIPYSILGGGGSGVAGEKRNTPVIVWSDLVRHLPASSTACPMSALTCFLQT